MPRKSRPPLRLLCTVLALHAVGRLAQLGDRRAEVVLDVLVGRDARRDTRDAALADQLVVDRTCRLVRVPHVVAQLLVVERAIDIRFDIAGRVRDLVFRLGHIRRFLSVAGKELSTPRTSFHSRSLRGLSEGRAGGQPPSCAARASGFSAPAGLEVTRRTAAGRGGQERRRGRLGDHVYAPEAIQAGALRRGRRRARRQCREARRSGARGRSTREGRRPRSTGGRSAPTGTRRRRFSTRIGFVLAGKREYPARSAGRRRHADPAAPAPCSSDSFTLGCQRRVRPRRRGGATAATPRRRTRSVEGDGEGPARSSRRARNPAPARLCRQILQVVLVLARQDHALQPGALCGEHLLAQAADREHLPRQRDLAGHSDLVGDRASPRTSDAIAVAIVIPAEGPSFGTAPAGTCTWTSCSANQSAGSPSCSAWRANPGERGLRRLLHDLAELAGDRQLAPCPA